VLEFGNRLLGTTANKNTKDEANKQKAKCITSSETIADSNEKGKNSSDNITCPALRKQQPHVGGRLSYSF
jgi:hypothetical protein